MVGRKTGLGIKIIAILTASIVIGIVLLVGVYALPVEEMKKNAQRSIELYDYEGAYPQLMTGYKLSQLDNITDATMILNAIFPGTGSIVRDAMQNYQITYRGKHQHQVDTLTDYANDLPGEFDKMGYPRYWHGYLVILKPLLLFFDISDIRMINMLLQMSLFIYIICLMIQKQLNRFILPFVFAVFMINPLATAVSFQFSTVYYIMLLSVLYILKKDILEKEEEIIFFLLIGIVTAYLDFLTFPLVALYFPMIFIFMKEDSWKKSVKQLYICSLIWILGYTGMWAGKWLIGSILTGENIVKNAMLRSAYYVGGGKTGNYILPDYMEKHPTIDKMAGCAGWCRCFS